MKKTTIISVILLTLLLAAMLHGCTDELGAVDLSGEIDLVSSTQGWAYRTVDSASFDRSNLPPQHRISEFRQQLELEKEVSIGKKQYDLVTRFTPGFKIFDFWVSPDRNGRGFQTLVYSFANHNIVDTFISKQSESGEPWDEPLDLPRNNAKKRVLERNGIFKATFYDPDTRFDCVIESCYKIESTAIRLVDKEGKFIIKDGEYQYDRVSVNGSSEMNIGFRQCLTGEKVICGQKIHFFILDWNMDGKFTEEDVVWCDYNRKFLDFGKIIRLTDSFSSAKDNKYVLNLQEPAKRSGTYRLQIKLAAEGKR